MNQVRIALANVRFPDSPEESITLATQAITKAASAGAQIICFPECFVPGYRDVSRRVPAPDAAFLDRAWATIAEAAGKATITVVLGTERVVDGALVASAIVTNDDGSVAGFQDKAPVGSAQRPTYVPGRDRRGVSAGARPFRSSHCPSAS